MPSRYEARFRRIMSVIPHSPQSNSQGWWALSLVANFSCHDILIGREERRIMLEACLALAAGIFTTSEYGAFGL